MTYVLDWINLDEILPLIVLICLLNFVGGQMTRPDPETYRLARRIAAATFLLYAGMGIYAWAPSSIAGLVVIVIRAILAAGVVFGLATILLPRPVYVYECLKARLRKWQEEARWRAEQRERDLQRIVQDQAKRADEEEQARQRAQAPSRAEIVHEAVARAKQDYHIDCEKIRSLGLRSEEKRAALLQAKQRLIQRLNEALQ